MHAGVKVAFKIVVRAASERRKVYCPSAFTIDGHKCTVLQLRVLPHFEHLEKKEIPYKRACEGHRVHSGYTVLSLNPIPGGKITNKEVLVNRQGRTGFMRLIVALGQYLKQHILCAW